MIKCFTYVFPAFLIFIKIIIMASIRAILWKKKKSAKQHPIVIRITKNRRPAYFFTGQYIASKFWDKTIVW